MDPYELEAAWRDTGDQGGSSRDRGLKDGSVKTVLFVCEAYGGNTGEGFVWEWACFDPDTGRLFRRARTGSGEGEEVVQQRAEAAYAQWCLERTGGRQHAKKRWQLTVAGFFLEPKGPDLYPDVYEMFEGTEEELKAHILNRETVNREAHLLRDFGLWTGTRNHPDVPGGRIDGDLFREMQLAGGDSPVWLRAVVEIQKPGFDWKQLVTRAHEAAPASAEAKLQAALAARRNRKGGD